MDDSARVHIPVMVDEVVKWLRPRDGGWIADLTAGAGGHAAAILAATASGRVLALDRDLAIRPVAEQRLAAFGTRVAWVHAASDQLGRVCRDLGIGELDGALLDLGVSSLQLDRAERGFSFDQDGPLDMRMDRSSGASAADFVNRASRAELLAAIGELGEEPRAGRIVDAILAARRGAPLRRTCELADIVAVALKGAGPRHHHPATRTFLGLRLAVNDELGILERTLPQVADLLGGGARLAVVAFHGTEDGIVKRFIRSEERAGRAAVLTAKPELPAAGEIARNPRARSARLRAMERLRNDARG